MLPLELCELIIDAVAYDVTGWDFAKVRETLKSCCLVCKSWVPQCRAHLWRTITVHGDRELTKFFQLLSTHPEYGTQVKELSLFISARRSLVFPLLLARKLPHVGCITVHCSMNDAPYVSFPHPSRHFSSFSELAPVTTWSLSGFIFPSVTTFIRVCAAFPQLECVSCFGTTWHKNSGGELSLFRAVNVTSLRVSNTRFPGLSGLWAILTSLPALKSFVCEFVTWDDVNMDTTMAAAPPLSDRLSELCDLSVRDVDFTVQFVDMLLAVFDLRPLITLRAFPHEMCQMEQVARLCHASGSSLRHLFIGDMSKPSLIVSNYPDHFPSLSSNTSLDTLRFEVYSYDMLWFTAALNRIQLPSVTKLTIMTNCPNKMRKVALDVLDRDVARSEFSPTHIIFEVYPYQLPRWASMWQELSRLMPKASARGALWQPFQPESDREWWERI